MKICNDLEHNFVPFEIWSASTQETPFKTVHTTTRRAFSAVCSKCALTIEVNRWNDQPESKTQARPVMRNRSNETWDTW